MGRLFMIIYALVSTALAGSAVVAVLTMNLFDVRSIVAAAVAGALLAAPVAWVIARKVSVA